MKKLLMGSIALTSFSIAILIFQMSCKKGANAQTTTTGTTQLNKIIYVRRIIPNPEIWTANYDGTNQMKINVATPTGITIDDGARLSPDGQTIFFEGDDTIAEVNHIYSCKIDGSNVKKIVDGSGVPQGVFLGGAY